MDAMAALFHLPLLLALTTPSTPPAPATTSTQIKAMTACLAVTRTEVEAAIGQPIGNGKEHKDRATSSCQYEGADGQVTVAIYRSLVKLNLQAEIKQLQKSIPEAKIRDLQGLGTRAFFMDMGGIGTQLHVIRGDYDYVLVSVLGFGGASQVSTAAETIARRALDRF
jgi:hypothetical protein